MRSATRFAGSAIEDAQKIVGSTARSPPGLNARVSTPGGITCG
jgi:pyrroline-5-carboxylate reductase